MGQQSVVVMPGPAVLNISPMGFHRFASEFAKLGRQAHDDSGAGFSPVPYFMYCRSVELVLKAFLLTKGLTKDDLKRTRGPDALGHDLTKILAKARALGLESEVPVRADWEAELQKANSYYADKGFEYFDVGKAVRGYKGLPELDMLRAISQTLLETLETICLEA